MTKYYCVQANSKLIGLQRKWFFLKNKKEKKKEGA
jgi:hypothetical protein